MKMPLLIMVVTVTAITALTNREASAQDASRPQPAPPSQADVAKQLSNPIANLVSVPLQLNWEEGVGPNEDLRYVMNFQPVVPFSVNDKWNLIGRMILPFVGQPALGAGDSATAGTGDILLSGFFSPAEVRGVLWGVGPVFNLPTTTDPHLGSGKWSIGPTAVVLKQSGPITAGALVNHLWSVGSTGKTERSDVNQTFLQPFVSYTTRNAVTLSVNLEATGNWEAPEDNQWSVPVNVTVSKMTRFGPFPFSLGAGVGIYAASPDGGPEWKLRMNMTLILPKAR